MPNSMKKDNPTRELPISLQGIETILLFLNEKDKTTSSIRNISEQTRLSMRVVKNILLQLEKFNQVERVTVKNNILPKWRITKFGKKVIKEAKGIEKNVKFLSREDELLYRISVYESIDDLKEESRQKQESIISELGTLQIELSKILGPILNINNPIFEDLMSFFIKRVKFLNQRVSNLLKDPIASYSLKKIGEKQKKVSKEKEKLLFTEIYFFNSVILNEIKRISDFMINLSHFIENEAISNAYSVAIDLREEIRLLTSFIYQRESLNVNSHKLPTEDLKQLSKNKFSVEILDNIIEIPMDDPQRMKGIEDAVLEFLASLNKGEKLLKDHSHEISENIPLYALYQLILDEKPNLNFTIDKLERVLNSLADNGYIPGIKIIQEDEDHYLKVVQLRAHDISEDESNLISFALKLQKFTLADMIGATGWTMAKITKILNTLTELGIIKYSKSFLHGEQWYIVSEHND
ncbi:hypothetical protein LCGC14_1030230 [marine sediment metagenome]|uniref:Uncharacterized protein n=1 Tax=marine sediment metagenome TaxID=412755 RepID=A0A0F9MZD0_9ZZZZ